MKKKVLIPALILAALIAAGLWYTRPQTIWEISGLERSAVTDMAATASMFSSSSETFDIYTLNALEPDDPEFDVLLDLLEQSHYRASLRNLLPFPSDSMDAVIDPTIHIYLSGNEDSCSPIITSPETLSLVPVGSNRRLQFSITDRRLQNDIFQYLKEYGDTDPQESQP